MNMVYKEKEPNGSICFYVCGIKVLSIRPQKWINLFMGIIQAPYINYKLAHCKYVHLMHTEKFTEATIRLFNENFNAEEHLFLCALVKPYRKIPKAANVYELYRMQGLNFKRKNIEKIICHGLFVPCVSKWLYKNPKISREKCYWVIWGGDLYDMNENTSDAKYKKFLSIRQNFRGYITAFDKQKACEMLNVPASKFYKAFVEFPITKEMIEATHKEKHDYIQIQINNSANKTTLEMLDILSKWKDKNIRITTILSYGDTEYVEQIKQKGKEIFGEKFSYLEQMLSAMEYTRFLAQNDILILNHNRQQGVGNTIASLNLGTKIFIKSDVSTYNYFNNEEQIKVFDSYQIQDMSFEEFVAYPQERENRKKASRYYDDDYLVSLWKDILDD